MNQLPSIFILCYTNYLNFAVYITLTAFLSSD
jgi:hypothetical protein